MAYDEAGSGPAVVLIHSGVTDRRMWEPQWASLTEQFRVVRFDLRGFGETPLPPERFSFATDVMTLLDHTGIESAAIVGSSFGGRVALEVATLHPDRVSRLVLLCTALRGIEPTPDAVAFDEQEEALLEADDRDGYVELNIATWLGPEADEDTRALVRVMHRQSLDMQLAAESDGAEINAEQVDVDPALITARTTLASGGHDLELFRQIADHLAATMPNAARVHLPWAGHLPNLERPAEITELIRTHVGRS